MKGDILSWGTCPEGDNRDTPKGGLSRLSRLPSGESVPFVRGLEGADWCCSSAKALSHAFSPIRAMADGASATIARKSGPARPYAANTPQPTRQPRPANDR